MSRQTSFKYLINSELDELWGITVNNVGEYLIPPDYDVYPPVVGHPEEYYFSVRNGRILDNYQLIYISGGGRGWYHETPEKRVEIKGGSMLIIPPYTWHSYYPDKKAGWHEYWIGLRGEHIDSRFRNGFFNRDKIIHRIGSREHIIALYQEAISIALKEEAGYQQILAAIANSIAAYTMYYERNTCYSNNSVTEKIDLARSIMRENILTGITPQEIAEKIHTSYSWFRKTFKEYTNVSPAHYLTQLKLQRAKSLLLNTSMDIKEIAFQLNFQDATYFSSIFKKYIKCSPSKYRSQANSEAEEESE